MTNDDALLQAQKKIFAQGPTDIKSMLLGKDGKWYEIDLEKAKSNKLEPELMAIYKEKFLDYFKD